jgi:hypothetical protein
MNSETKWYPVKERLPESGEEVIAYYWNAYDEDDGFPTCVICTYHKAGDILENEMPYKERVAVSMGKATGIERLFSLLFETRNVPAERDGFYFYDVNSEGLMEWRRHNDEITHWRRMPTRKEVEGVKK